MQVNLQGPVKGKDNNMAKLFIDKPVLAIVVSLIIVIAGGVSIFSLPLPSTRRSHLLPFR